VTVISSAIKYSKHLPQLPDYAHFRLLTLRKLRLGGHQRISIQHIQVRKEKAIAKNRWVYRGFYIQSVQLLLLSPMTGSLRRDEERDKSEAAQANADEEDRFPDCVPGTAPFNSVHGRATQSTRRRQTGSTRPMVNILPLLKPTSVRKDADRRCT